MFPKVGHLTGDDLDDIATGSLIRTMMQHDLGVRATGSVAGSDASNRLPGAGWPKSTDNQVIYTSYLKWKHIILTAAEQRRTGRS